MKKSITYLPKYTQEDLNYLVDMVLERIPQTQIIILYGSYATGKYVERDSRIEFGVRTNFMSDYDLLVVTHGVTDKEAGHKLDNIEDIYYKSSEMRTPVQFINYDIKKLNSDLSEGRYFYTQIREEGIIIYDTGKFKLAEGRELRYDEIKRQAEEYFEEKFSEAEFFYDDVITNYERGRYKRASFYVHQAFENLIYAVRLVFTLESNKQHNLSKLLVSVSKYSDEFEKIFSSESEEEMRLFNLAKAAYVEARYNSAFVVTKEDLDALIPKLELLQDITSRICAERINEYGGMIEDDDTYLRILNKDKGQGMVAEDDENM